MALSLDDAAREAMASAPVSLRALARESGVSFTLLQMIQKGERRATPATVEKLASALERLAERHASAARQLRDSLNREVAE